MNIRLNSGESDQCCDDIFVAVEGKNRVVRGGWPVAVVLVQIQCFIFGSRG
jgi:hypothetical protein